MENFNLHDIRPFAFLVTGSIFILLAIFSSRKQTASEIKVKKLRTMLLAIAGLLCLAVGLYQLLAPE